MLVSMVSGNPSVLETEPDDSHGASSSTPPRSVEAVLLAPCVTSGSGGVHLLVTRDHVEVGLVLARGGAEPLGHDVPATDTVVAGVVPRDGRGVGEHDVVDVVAVEDELGVVVAVALQPRVVDGAGTEATVRHGAPGQCTRRDERLAVADGGGGADATGGETLDHDDDAPCWVGERC